jgi:hypothetical protein
MFVNINVTPCDGTEKLLWRKMVNEEASGRSMLSFSSGICRHQTRLSIRKSAHLQHFQTSQADGTKSQDIAPRVGKKKTEIKLCLCCSDKFDLATCDRLIVLHTKKYTQ